MPLNIQTCSIGSDAQQDHLLGTKLGYILIVTNILPGQLGKSALHMWPLQKDVAALTPN